MKLNIYGHQPLIAPRDPVLPMEAATKNYVDTELDFHASDMDLHVTKAQSELLNSLDISADELNSLTGITGNIQSQLDSKLSKEGGAMTGDLTLAGKPTESLHASSKSYVDQERDTRVAKEGDTMTGHLTLNADPVTNLHAATKQFVDSSLSAHANDEDLHMTPSQNLWMDSITVNASEVNHLDGVTSNVQEQLSSKLNLSGGQLTGDITFAEGKTAFVSKTPNVPTELVNKAYVDSKFMGQEWKDPITDPNLLAVDVEQIPSAPVDRGTYIASIENPPLSWLPGHAYTYDELTQDWVQLQGRAVEAGDRFGVGLEFLLTDVDVSVAENHGKLVTVTDIAEGKPVLTEDALTPGSTTLVFDPESSRFGVSYSYTDEGNWVPTNVSANLVPGQGLELEGNTLKMKLGNGLQFTNEELAVKTKLGAVLKSNEDGLDLPFEGTHFQISETGQFEIAEEVLTDIADRLSKSQGGDVNGTINITDLGSLVIGYTPVLDTQAIPKKYADDQHSTVTQSVSGLDERLQILEEDPVTKTHVTSEVGTKVSKAGDTMTGFLTLNEAPTSNLHASTKKYVDDTVSTHENKTDIHFTPEQKTWIEGVTVTPAEVNQLAGIENNVQSQLDSKLDLAGGTMTGELILSGEPVGLNEAVTKDYSDKQAATKLNLAGGTLTGPLVLSGEPTADLEASTKLYTDNLVAGAESYTDQETAKKVNKAGDTLTGFLNLHSAPEQDNHASTKKYVDDSILASKSDINEDLVLLDGRVTTNEGRLDDLELDPVTKSYVNDGLDEKVNKEGDSMTGFLSLHANPEQSHHAVTKQYVDALAQGLRVKAAVRYATVTNLTANYNNGSSGVDSTLTGTGNGALVVDGGTVAVGDRVLVMRQTNKAENGDYLVTQVGDTSTPFKMKRTTTVDESHEVPGSYFYVYDGVTLKGTGWTFEVDSPADFVIGTNDIHVNQFSGQGTVIPGSGLELNGNTLNIVTANQSRIKVQEADIDLAKTGVVAGTGTKMTVDEWGRITASETPTSYVDLGLTDVQPLNGKLTSLSNLATSGLLVITDEGKARSRSILPEGLGIDVVNPAGLSGDIKITSNATSDATPETIVYRDTNGDFSANVVTGSLSGNAATATKLRDARDVKVTSTDMTSDAVSFNGTDNVELEVLLTDTGVVAGTGTKLTVDAKGRVTASETPEAIADLGIKDVYTKAEVDQLVSDISSAYFDLHNYVMSRI